MVEDGRSEEGRCYERRRDGDWLDRGSIETKGRWRTASRHLKRMLRKGREQEIKYIMETKNTMSCLG